MCVIFIYIKRYFCSFCATSSTRRTTYAYQDIRSCSIVNFPFFNPIPSLGVRTAQNNIGNDMNNQEKKKTARKGRKRKGTEVGKKFDYAASSDQHWCVSRLFASIPFFLFWRAFHTANFNEIRTEVCIIDSWGRGA